MNGWAGYTPLGRLKAALVVDGEEEEERGLDGRMDGKRIRRSGEGFMGKRKCFKKDRWKVSYREIVDQ